MPLNPPTLSASSLEELILQLNQVFSEFADHVETIYGVDSKQFKTHNDLDFNNFKAVNLGDPEKPDDGTSKEYVDELVGDKLVGPKSSIDNTVARFDGTTGKIIQGSLATLSDAGSFDIPLGQTYNIGGVPHTHADSGSKLATVEAINAKAVAGTTIYTVPDGKSLVVVDYFMRCTALTGAKTVQATASFGANASDYDDYLVASEVIFSAAGMVVKASAVVITEPSVTLSVEYPVYAAGKVLKLNITTGSDAAIAETWSVDLFGYLI